MPAKQRGFARKRSTGWLAGWYVDGRQVTRGGFGTRSAALDYAQTKAAETVARREAVRFGDPLPEHDAGPVTVSQLVDGFLDSHEVDPATTVKLRRQLRYAVSAFGDRPIATLTPLELASWRATLPAGSRHYVFRAFRQVLEQAVTWEMLDKNPTARIKNRAAGERAEQRPFSSWEDVEAVADELDARYRAVPIVLVGTGLRPEELFALERRDVDLREGVATVERVYSQGRLKEPRKSTRQRRRVPLRRRVVEAIEGMPPRIDSPLLFPAPRGGYVDLERFRYREWTPALRAAGIEHRRIYDCRHTFATWAIAGGMQLFYLARIMGTSVAQIDATYGHLLPDSEEYLRGLLDDYDDRVVAGEARR
jgi:integrase